jgi:hypothetical protein
VTEFGNKPRSSSALNYHQHISQWRYNPRLLPSRLRDCRVVNWVYAPIRCVVICHPAKAKNGYLKALAAATLYCSSRCSLHAPQLIVVWVSARDQSLPTSCPPLRASPCITVTAGGLKVRQGGRMLCRLIVVAIRYHFHVRCQVPEARKSTPNPNITPMSQKAASLHQW